MYKNLFKIREMLREIRITKETNLPWNEAFLKNRHNHSYYNNLYEYIQFMTTQYESFLVDKKICRCPISFDIWLKAQIKGACFSNGEPRCSKNCPFRDVKFSQDIDFSEELFIRETENEESEEVEDEETDLDNFENYIRENFQEEDEISIKQLLDYINDFKNDEVEDE